MSKNKNLKVIELFAGVGGFRLGLEKASDAFKIAWSNQWEPSTLNKQEASDIYIKRFGETNHSNKDIAKVGVDEIPEHDMLVGGFPCQDYSVATSTNKSKGLEGKKGVMWWEICRILESSKKQAKYLFLENVDRLLKSPTKQRGRDFAIMLASLAELGYIVEWRIINAADYGMPQRRRRVFILGYHESTKLNKQIRKLKNPLDWIIEDGVMAESLEVNIATDSPLKSFLIEGKDLAEISSTFNKEKSKLSPFENSGIMIDKKVWTIKTKSSYEGIQTTLGDLLLPDKVVPKSFFIDEKTLEKWEYLKGAKSSLKTNKATGITYKYAEGGMVFPDPLNKPSRTIITGEGGASPSRFKHVVKTKSGKLRRLVPIELERLNMFPDNHTEGASDTKRAFFMGNALVVGIIEKIGKTLAERVSN